MASSHFSCMIGSWVSLTRSLQCWDSPSGSSLTLLSMNFWPQLPKSCIWAQVNWALVLPRPAVYVDGCPAMQMKHKHNIQPATLLATYRMHGCIVLHAALQRRSRLPKQQLQSILPAARTYTSLHWQLVP